MTSTSSPRVPRDLTPGWFLETWAEVTSTNLVAANLPPWHAVRASVQTGGFGRTGRTWVSDLGGLWLSAVLPCPAPRDTWSLLPLAVGHALLTTLTELGVPALRLRWPNDLLVGSRKVAGLLVERRRPDTAVVGLGINVSNHPSRHQPDLHRLTSRLAHFLPAENLNLDSLAGLALHAIAQAHHTLLAGEFPRVAQELNLAWRHPRPVTLTLAGSEIPVQGDFLGIDDCGDLLLRTPDGHTQTHDARRVALLREN